MTGETHKLANQSPPYGGHNLFETDPLLNSAASGFPDAVRADLSEIGAFWGTHEAREFARLDRKSTRLNSSHVTTSRMPSSA